MLVPRHLRRTGKLWTVASALPISLNLRLWYGARQASLTLSCRFEIQRSRNSNRLITLGKHRQWACADTAIPENEWQFCRLFAKLGIPATPDREVFIESPEGGQGRSVPSFGVLIVEDFEAFRRLVCSILEKWAELQVICEVSDGLEAVRKPEELQPDLILLPPTRGL